LRVAYSTVVDRGTFEAKLKGKVNHERCHAKAFDE
jgi:hypothetical protein